MKAKEIIAMIDGLIEDGYAPYNEDIYFDMGMFKVYEDGLQIFTEDVEIEELPNQKQSNEQYLLIYTHVSKYYDSLCNIITDKRKIFIDGGLKALKDQK